MVVRDKGTAKYQDACHTPLIFLSSLKTYSGLKTNSLTYKRSQIGVIIIAMKDVLIPD